MLCASTETSADNNDPSYAWQPHAILFIPAGSRHQQSHREHATV